MSPTATPFSITVSGSTPPEIFTGISTNLPDP
jgi:hypothetical protein